MTKAIGLDMEIFFILASFALGLVGFAVKVAIVTVAACKVVKVAKRDSWRD
jgi:hypothetical protein